MISSINTELSGLGREKRVEIYNKGKALTLSTQYLFWLLKKKAANN